MAKAKWLPERSANGAWQAVRYGEDGKREVDAPWDTRLNAPIPRYFETMAQCQPRCDELNAED